MLAGPLLLAVLFVRVFSFALAFAYQQNITSIDFSWDTTLTKKIKVLINGENNFDGLLFGSSGLVELDPRVVDKELMKAGLKSRSYNFSLAATTLPEMYLGLKSLADSGKVNLKWIIFDLSIPSTNPRLHFDENNERETFQHPLEEVLMRTKYSKAKPFEILYHWAWYLRRLSFPRYDGNFVLNDLSKIDFPGWPFDLERGFLILKDRGIFRQWRRFKDESLRKARREEFLNAVEQLSVAPKSDCDEYQIAMYERLVALAKKLNPNIKLLFVNPPILRMVWSKSCDFNSKFGNYDYLNLQSPGEYPEFFVYEDRWDFDHLQGPALANMGTVLGRRLSKVLTSSARVQ
jgi:hypothetical protein